MSISAGKNGSRHLVMAALAVIFLFPLRSLAWGSKGHAIASEIAFSLISDATKQKVQHYLGDMTPDQAGNWMDNVRSDHNYDFMKTWHYLNVEKGDHYAANHDENVVNALNTAISKLEHRDKLSDSEIRFNVLVVFHLTEDMQMPLHVGYGTDKGGNTVHVTYNGHPSNLHRVWDSEIIESEKITTADCLALYKEMNKADIERYGKVNIEGWIDEPRSLLDKVYDFPADGVIGQDYIDRNKKIVEQQLVIAGVRLAAVLQQVFGA